MPTYAIGDVQGCYAELRSLLRECGFDARRDLLWFVGDLVNRGPCSLDVLRFVADLGDRAHTVLGNHDLHLVASARGVRKLRDKDTFHDVLDAADGEALIDWLRGRPMIHLDSEQGFVMVHAGIAPAWTIDDALGYAAELSRALRAPDHPRLLSNMYGNEPDEWRDSLTGLDRLRFITNAFTRMRYCHANGRLDFSESRPPGEQDSSLTPWFTLRDGSTDRARIVFGHWATLQLRTALLGICTSATSIPGACGAAHSPRCAWRTTGNSGSTARAVPHRLTSETTSRHNLRSWLRIATSGTM